MSRPDVAPVLEFLRIPTPSAWLAAVPTHIPQLLIDHANCEKKAASTALSLMYKYVDQTQLLHKMSRLAREELRHFEQVLDLMTEQGVEYSHLGASRYAKEMHKLVAKQEPQRLVDLLVLGAVVEARSCERFVALLEILPADIVGLYQQLVFSEARHFAEYLQLAEEACDATNSSIDVAAVVDKFLAEDARLISSVDTEFRFHSGVPG